jgi:hypothetical protein
MMKLIATILFIVAFLFVVLIARSHAEEHSGHAAKDMEIHKKFYQTWMMPKNRAASCCHDQDCAPAEVRFKDGKIYARQEEGSGEIHDFVEVPADTIEHDRDSPDGRNHLCGRKYTYMGSSMDATVYCFIAGSGG